MTTFDKHKEYWLKKNGIPGAMLEFMPDVTDMTVLDLGCGGGRLTASLPAAALFGIDNSVDLLKSAKSSYPHINFVCGDFQSGETWGRIPSANLIISNCAIRKDYCPNLTQIIRLAHDKLATSGILLLRVQVVEDLSEVLPMSVRSSLFYSGDELLSALKMFRVTTRDESYRQKFSDESYMRTFLERIQIRSSSIKNLNPTRRYLVVCAEKSE